MRQLVKVRPQKRIYITLLILTVSILFGYAGFSQVNAHQSDKLTVCHHTESNTNPWVEQTINANELLSHIANGDFLVNADHSCPPVTPTPTVKANCTPTPIEEISPTDEPSTSPDLTETPTSGVSATLTPETPTATPTAAPGSTNDHLGCGEHSCAPAQSQPNQPEAAPATGRAE